jgi:threonine aldolase
MQHPRSFASDNNASIHPTVLEALIKANSGQYVSYGADPLTKKALLKFKEHFGEDSEAFFVFNGTAANVLGLKLLVKPYQAILCAEHAHIEIDECGAPESHIGSKLILVPTVQGKLTPDNIEKKLAGVGDQHHVQPRVVSIAQTTEFGSVYSLTELKNLSYFCKKNDLYFHMDGARLSNAAAALNVGLKELTGDVGVDVLSFGGTKNGLLAAEAVVVFDSGLAGEFKYIRKQGMQLASKMRYFAVQFETLLTDDLWLKNAQHANQMTAKLFSELQKISEVSVVYKPEANAIFATLPKKAIELLQKEYFFYVIDEARGLARFMTSFETVDEDISGFVSALKLSLKRSIEA